MDLEEFVDEVRRDLADGDDLAMAMTLIGDALQRRVRRVRRSLDVAARHDSEEFERVADQVRHTLDRYETALEQGRAELEHVIKEFQSELDDSAERLDDVDL